MKKTISLLLIIICIFSTCVCAENDNASASVPEGLRSGNILLMDQASSKVIYEKNSDERISPGGFTKLFTAAVIFDYINSVDEKVTANPKAVTTYDFTHNNMGVLPGETLTVNDLLHGMLIYDAGEAANALAVYSADTMDKFVAKMNQKAAQIGCSDTYFTNPSGLPDENQYSTLKDVALIVNYAMENEIISGIVKTKSYKINPSNKYSETRYLNNTNKFISNASTNEYYTKNATGAKTSYVSNNDCGLALTYEKGNLKFLCITSNSPYANGINYANEDSKKLIDYALEYYTSEKLLSRDEIMAEVKVRNGKESGKVLLVCADDLFVNLPKNYNPDLLEKITETNKKVKAPISKGDALGQVTVLYNGEKYASAILVADASVSSAPIKGFFASIGAIFTSWIFIALVILIIGLFIFYTIMLNKIKRRKKYVSRFR